MVDNKLSHFVMAHNISSCAVVLSVLFLVMMSGLLNTCWWFMVLTAQETFIMPLVTFFIRTSTCSLAVTWRGYIVACHNQRPVELSLFIHIDWRLNELVVMMLPLNALLDSLVSCVQWKAWKILPVSVTLLLQNTEVFIVCVISTQQTLIMFWKRTLWVK